MSSAVPEGWILLPLGSVAKIFSGGTPSRSDTSNYIGEIPWVKSGEVNQRKVYFTEEKISDHALKSSSAKWVKNGSVLVAMYGATAGKVARLLIDATINQAIAAVCSDSEEVSNDFLFHEVEFKSGKLLDSVQGSGQPNLSGQLVKELKVSLPPLPEQKKIASILTSVDEVIETTQKQIDKLQDLKKATMNELLTKGIGHTEFKDSELGRIPKSWECLKMGDLAKVTDGAHQTPKYVDSGVPFLRVTDIQSAEINVKKTKYISTSEHLELCRRCNPEKGDILYSKNGTIGISKIVNWDWDFSIFVSLALLKLHDKNSLQVEFLDLFLQSPVVAKQIKDRAKQGTVTNLHLEEIRKFDVVVPSVEEQSEIKTIIRAIEFRLHNVKQKLSQTQSLKKSLMQDLLTGKVRVKVN